MRSSGRSEHVCRHERRTARQARALVRQSKRYTPLQQLARLNDRPGESRKERRKLHV